MDETKPFREEFGVGADEHAADVQADVAFAVAFEHVEGAVRGHEEKGVEFELAFGAPMQGGPGFIKTVAEVAIELGVGFFFDFGFGLAPPTCRTSSPAAQRGTAWYRPFAARIQPLGRAWLRHPEELVQ